MKYRGISGHYVSFPHTNFLETNAIFLEFADDLDNLAGGSSSVGDNSESSSQPFTTLTPRRRVQSQLLELEHYVAVNGWISMTITPSAEKPIFPHVVRFSQTIGVCVQKIFLLLCLKWTDVGREYIEVIKTDLQFFVLDFNDQAMNRRLEQTHQTYWWDVMRIYTSSVTTTCVVHSRSNHGRTRLLDKSSLTIIAAGQSRFYNDSTSPLSKEESWSTVWSCSDKHTFEMGQSNVGTPILTYPTLQELGGLPMHTHVGGSAKNIGIRCPDAKGDIRNNVRRKPENNSRRLVHDALGITFSRRTIFQRCHCVDNKYFPTSPVR
ncbi:CACTA en-spm transposon protein [Cucumis melo var. makuwa]|uniref:CACTA en-spm transposon protein n=1 Tax=Cucumis melo var. makuwa TaxID=1194695 RepID=A0A5A7UES6_CUCMM|nr:CACTA en-spm transposon protein [Cucumis melo var. makuwa]TYK01774.1 CACTA en-spm transposon protein [Cucumis melo var. makuwa]